MGRSPLDDPATAAHAWAHYKRLMRWMVLVALAVIVVVLGVVYWQTGMVSAHMFIATALGVGFTALLMGALMGLVFLSSGTGHDESVSGWDGDDAGDGRNR